MKHEEHEEHEKGGMIAAPVIQFAYCLDTGFVLSGFFAFFVVDRF